VRSMAIDREGRYMVSTGQDLKMAVWDLRMFKEINNYFLRAPSPSVAISDRGSTAVGWGTTVSIWNGLFDKARADQTKIQSPYMSWGGDGRRIERVRWCPFEDILGVSHSAGFSSIIVPGAGEPNFDALEINPYENTKQRQEGEVKMLLNKLQPDMISLNPEFIGQLDRASNAQRVAEKDLDRKPEDPITKLKNKARGKNSALRKHLRKKARTNIVDDKSVKLDEIRKENAEKRKRLGEQSREKELGPALARFAKNSSRGSNL
jgi:U3 small nucleolar RNA-associated protein 7